MSAALQAVTEHLGDRGLVLYLQADDSGSTRMYTWRYEPLRLLWTLRRR
jgi:hypothetical protein